MSNERVETAQTEAKIAENALIAAQKVVQHLREYGPNARVLLVVPSQKTLKTVCLFGPEGLLTLYGEEFSASNPTRQLTHKGGGVVQVDLLKAIAYGKRTGQLWSCAWLEGVSRKGDTEEMARMTVNYGLKAQPQLLIESTMGVYYDESDGHEGGS